MPAISIIVPFYNRHGLIGETVESVLQQGLTDLEIVIVDDGSREPLKPSDLGRGDGDARIRLFRQDNRGSGAARNAALREARGDHVLFLDSDDLLVPGGLEVLLARAREGDFDAVVGNWRDLVDGRAERHFRPSFPYRDALANVVDGGWATGSALLKRSLRPVCPEEKSRLPWDMAECYLRALSDPAARIAHVDRDIVMMRQDSDGRLTVLYDHFDPVKAGRFWCEMKASFALDDERRAAFDHQIFRFVLTLFHAGENAAAAELFASIDADRLKRHAWCSAFSPAWFAATLGLSPGLGLQRLLHRLRGGRLG